jgi:hypothetical protein
MKWLLILVIFGFSSELKAVEWSKPLKISVIELFSEELFVRVKEPVLFHSFVGCEVDKRYLLIKFQVSQTPFRSDILAILINAKGNDLEVSFQIVDCKNNYMVANAIKLE